MELSELDRRGFLCTGLAGACLSLSDLVMADGDDAATGAVEIDVEAAAEVHALWNRARMALRSQSWDSFIELMLPAERQQWWRLARSEARHDLSKLVAAVHFPYELAGDNSKVLCYRYETQTIARVYSECRRDIESGSPRVGVTRSLLGHAVRRQGQHFQLDPANRDPEAVWLGTAVGGIRLRAHAETKMINAWEQLCIVMRFVNTSQRETISMPSKPMFLLESNFGIGFKEARCGWTRADIEKWYDDLRSSSPAHLGIVTKSLELDHSPIILRPGESFDRRVEVKEICWAANPFPAGPLGEFGLFVVYDANLDPDPLEAAQPTWQHRIASNKFRIEVGS